MKEQRQPEVSAPSAAGDQPERNGWAPLRLLLEDYNAHAFDIPTGLASLPPAPARSPSLRLLVEDFDPAARHREIFPDGSPDLDAFPAAEPDFLLDWRNRVDEGRRRNTRLGSFGVHLAGIAFLLFQPYIQRENEFTKPEPDSDRTDITLLAPSRELLAELTRDPDKQGDETKVFRGDAEQPRPAVVLPNPAPTQPTPPQPAPPQPIVPEEPKPEPAPQIIEEAPKPEPKPEPPQVAASQTPQPGPFQRGREIARTGRIQEIPIPPAQQKKRPDTKLILEDPKARMESEKGPIELARLGIGSRPDQLVDNAIQSMQERGGGPQAVGDGVGASTAGGYVAPSQGNIGSGLELLSDPKGVDFRPYLLQLLNIVRRNWYAVIPESSRLGLERGRVAVQFSVARDGGVPKLVIASSSNSQPLDRAAVAGVSASLPFPPLPREFTGDEIRLQFVFLYNMKR